MRHLFTIAPIVLTLAALLAPGCDSTDPKGTRTIHPSKKTADGITTEIKADGATRVSADLLPRSPHDPRNLPDYTPGDSLSLPYDADPPTLLPFATTDPVASEVEALVVETLVKRNPETLAIVPWLARSYEVAADGLSITYTLRDHLRFSDGSAITADDVVFSFKTMMEMTNDPARGTDHPVTGCEKVDDRTVRFILPKPYFKAVETTGLMGIIPQKTYSWTSRNDYMRRHILVGSGPYVYQSWQPGKEIVLVRNNNYWGPYPTFDRRSFRLFAPDKETAAFLARRIDACMPTAPEYAKYAQDKAYADRLTAVQYFRPGAGYRYVGYNLRKPMFADKLTRQGLSELVDRAGIVQTVEHGMATVVSGPFNPQSPQANAAIKPWPFDPKDGLDKLHQAGWAPNAQGILARAGQTFEFNLTVPNDNPINSQTAQAVRDALNKAGLRVKIVTVSFSDLVSRLDDRDFDAVVLWWSGSVESDPYAVWHSDSIKDTGSNFIGFTNPIADGLIDQGRHTLDTDARMTIWHTLHGLLHEEEPCMFLNAQQSHILIDKRFRNTRPARLGLDLDSWYVPRSEQKTQPNAAAGEAI